MRHVNVLRPNERKSLHSLIGKDYGLICDDAVDLLVRKSVQKCPRLGNYERNIKEDDSEKVVEHNNQLAH